MKNQSKYKMCLFELFDAPVDGASYEERMALIEKYGEKRPGDIAGRPGKRTQAKAAWNWR